jgi:hypothetical protein
MPYTGSMVRRPVAVRPTHPCIFWRLDTICALSSAHPPSGKEQRKMKQPRSLWLCAPSALNRALCS